MSAQATLHTSAVLNSNIQDFISQAMEQPLNNNESLQEDKLALVKLNKDPINVKIAELNSNSDFKEAFPWLVEEDGEFINFNEDISLDKGVRLASNYLVNRYNLDRSAEREISDIKLMDILKPFAGGTEENSTTILEFYEHLSSLFNKDYFKPLISNLVATDSQMERPWGSFADMTISAERELYLRLKNFNFPMPLTNLKIAVDIFQFIPAIIIYRGVVRSYVNTFHPLTEINLMEPVKRAEFLKK